MNSSREQHLLKYIWLALSLVVWVFRPIIGMFPLLLFVHFHNQHQKKIDHLSWFLTGLAVLTHVIFMSSQNIVSDTAFYVLWYQRLGEDTILEVSPNDGLEWVMYSISYPIYLISGGSNYAFLFFWSFFIDASLVYIALKISRKNFALILFYSMINLRFFSQLFLMRQFISSIFLLLAVVNLEKRIIPLLFYLASLFTHFTSIIYLPLIVIGMWDQKNSWTSQILSLWKRSKLFGIIALLLLITSAVVTIQQGALFRFFELFSSNDNIYDKTTFWATQDELSRGADRIAVFQIIVIFFLQTFFVKPLKKSHSEQRQDKILFLLFFIFSILYFLMSNVDSSLGLRVGLLILSFIGIFYAPIIERPWKVAGVKNIFLSLVALLLMARFFLFLTYNDYGLRSGELIYLKSQALNSTIFEYIQSAYDNSIHDVEIQRFRKDDVKK